MKTASISIHTDNLVRLVLKETKFMSGINLEPAISAQTNDGETVHGKLDVMADANGNVFARAIFDGVQPLGYTALNLGDTNTVPFDGGAFRVRPKLWNQGGEKLHLQLFAGATFIEGGFNHLFEDVKATSAELGKASDELPLNEAQIVDESGQAA